MQSITDQFAPNQMRIELMQKSRKLLGQDFVMLGAGDVRRIEGEFFDTYLGKHRLILSDEASERLGAYLLEACLLNEEQYKFLAPDQFATEPMTDAEIREIVELLISMDLIPYAEGYAPKKLRDVNPTLR